MADEELPCWRCGEILVGVMRPISRFAECPVCGADLHVCLFCRFYAPKLIGGCDHDRAEKVAIKDKANFCGYFRPSASAHDGSGYTANDEARAALDALFDEAPSSGEVDSNGAPDDDGAAQASGSDGERARRELDRLFGLSPDDDG